VDAALYRQRLATNLRPLVSRCHDHHTLPTEDILMQKRPMAVGIVFLIFGVASELVLWPELRIVQWLLPLTSGVVAGVSFARAIAQRHAASAK
jgi:hypothetical protein